MNKTEDVYLEGALVLHADRDRLARLVAAHEPAVADPPGDAEAPPPVEALEKARAACRDYLEGQVPITLQRRIRARLRDQGYEPES